eukprot:2101873-Alexandrium_andersonii.AAC.1
MPSSLTPLWLQPPGCSTSSMASATLPCCVKTAGSRPRCSRAGHHPTPKLTNSWGSLRSLPSKVRCLAAGRSPKRWPRSQQAAPQRGQA